MARISRIERKVLFTLLSSVNHCLKLFASFTIGTTPLKLGAPRLPAVTTNTVPLALPDSLVRVTREEAPPPRKPPAPSESGLSLAAAV